LLEDVTDMLDDEIQGDVFVILENVLQSGDQLVFHDFSP
jgi:hypothetical protein